jgi:stage II sporulation protein D
MKRRTFCVAAAAAATWVAIGSRVRAIDSPPIRILLGRGSAQALDAGSFSFGTRRFRGSFSSLSDGQIVNTLPLEEYLYGVVPMESPRLWPAATLQAQAIVARTFALRRINPLRPYDVTASQSDQAYGGLGAEHAETTAAVNATAGQVIRFAGSPATVSYMSCCGGHTEASVDAWQGGVSYPYLEGVVCTYCSASPDYRWVATVPWSAITNALAPQFNGFGVLRAADIAVADASGRAKSLRFSDGMQNTIVSGSDFRRAAGTTLVKSLLLRGIAVRQVGSDLADPTQSAAALIVQGGGRGHGVGLCQWGARALGAQGRDAHDILTYYFPGTDVGNG